MATPPGGIGLPVIGDKSLDFYRDAVGFVGRHIDKHKSGIFIARFLNHSHVFVASNAGVRQLLSDESSSFQMGYKQFMEGIYGHNVLFSDGDEAQTLRSSLQRLLLSSNTTENFNTSVDRLTTQAVSQLSPKTPVSIYQILKKLCTEICLTTFLDIDFELTKDVADSIVSLTTTHWHGIISVPLNLKLPMTTSKSTYGKALDAKKKLLLIIEGKLHQSSEKFPHSVKDGFDSHEMAANHLLLFTSALVPKAFASILTSFMIITAEKVEVQKACRGDKELLEHVLLEVQRMWPPFIGGRRIATKDSTIGGLKVAKGQAVIFMTHHAHRDPTVFTQPNKFMPERWNTSNRDDKDKLFTYGGGPRCCIGQHLSQYLLMTVCTEFLQKYKWELAANQDLSYKWLPVSRPKHDLSLIFTPIT